MKAQKMSKEYQDGYIKGYEDAKNRLGYDTGKDQDGAYEYGYSVGYEDGMYDEKPEYTRGK